MQGCASSSISADTAAWLHVAPNTDGMNSGKENQALEMHPWKGEFLFSHGGKRILDSLWGDIAAPLFSSFLKDLPPSAHTHAPQKR